MEQITDDHHTLRALLGELDAAIADESAKSLAPLTTLLEMLTNRLAEHFQREEKSDLYVGIPKRVPDLAARLAELKVDHGTILELLIDARGAVNRLDAARTEVTGQVTKLIDTLRAHERSEAEIIQRAFTSD